jgi:beta-lactamase class A
MAWPSGGHASLDPLREYEARSGGRVGLYAENLQTGVKIAWRAHERFVMCSTFKASLAACVLARVDRGEDHLDQVIGFGAGDLQPYAPAAREKLAHGAMSVGEMCQAMVELSDNTCANLLLARIGGPAFLTAFWRRIGDDVTRLDHNEPLLNRSPPGDPHDTTSPAAMAADVRRMVLGKVLSIASRQRLGEWMIGCRTGGNRLRAGLPKTWTIGDKTGNNGRDAAGDLAVAWPGAGGPLVVCAYVQGGAPSPAQIDAVFAAMGRMAARL